MNQEKLDNIVPKPCPVCGMAPKVRMNTIGWRIACDNFHLHGDFIAYGHRIEDAALKWNKFAEDFKG